MRLFEEGDADSVRVVGRKLERSPGLSGKAAVGMNFAAALLVLREEARDIVDDDAHHRLIADGLRYGFVGYGGDMNRGSIAGYASVIRRRVIAKVLRESADVSPPGE